jgi:hypothetical protein
MNIFDQLAADLSAEIDKQFAFARVPTTAAERLNVKLKPPYGMVGNITESSDETGFGDPHSSVDLVIQISSVGEDPKQVQWLSDRVHDAMVGKDPGGNYMVALLAGWNVAWRLCDYRGATLPSGDNLFQQQDNYRIRRGA